MDDRIEDRIILIRGGKSSWYEQAIFIVKPGAAIGKRADIVDEAESIISAFFYKNRDENAADAAEGYLPSASEPDAEPGKSFNALARCKRNRFDITLGVAMLACCLVMAAILLLTLK